MNQENDLFQEATLILSASLNMKSVLSDFFNFLQKHIPTKRIIVVRAHPEVQSLELVAQSTKKSVRIYNMEHLVPVTPAQRNMRDIMIKLAKMSEAHEVEDMSHPIVQYCQLGDPEYYKDIVPPFFFLRLNFNLPPDTIVHPSKQNVVACVIFFPEDNKPFSQENRDFLRSLRLPLCLTLDHCFQHLALQEVQKAMLEENSRLRAKLGKNYKVEVIGAEGGLSWVMEKAKLAAAVNIPVLISGETGTGKEVIAHAVHQLSQRAEQSFIPINCGGIPPTLIDSELFGYEKGAFTNATSTYKGRFERAHGGTIFLDEIGELQLDVQARLLRVLQERKIERVGGNTLIPVDFRLITATHRDLAQMVQEGLFREDLYYRLKVVSIEMPALRERMRDLPLLVNYFIKKGAEKFHIPAPIIQDGQMTKLMAYAWPGNVRELQNVVDEALVLNPKGPLEFNLASKLKKEEVYTEEKTILPDWENMQRNYFTAILEETKGRINGSKGAAVRTGLNPSTLRFKLDKLDIDYKKK